MGLHVPLASIITHQSRKALSKRAQLKSQLKSFSCGDLFSCNGVLKIIIKLKIFIKYFKHEKCVAYDTLEKGHRPSRHVL